MEVQNKEQLALFFTNLQLLVLWLTRIRALAQLISALFLCLLWFIARRTFPQCVIPMSAGFAGTFCFVEPLLIMSKILVDLYIRLFDH